MDLLNITNIDYENEIKKSVNSISKEYNELTREQTCFIYSSLIYESLRKKHMMARIVSTKDLGASYEHRFVLVKEKDYYYVVDLTFNQFFEVAPDLFKCLSINGYQKVDRDTLEEYVKCVSREAVKDEVEGLFFR